MGVAAVASVDRSSANTEKLQMAKSPVQQVLLPFCLPAAKASLCPATRSQNRTETTAREEEEGLPPGKAALNTFHFTSKS